MGTQILSLTLGPHYNMIVKKYKEQYDDSNQVSNRPKGL